MRFPTLVAFIALIAAPTTLASYTPYARLDSRSLNREGVARVHARHFAEAIIDVLERRWLEPFRRSQKPVTNNVPHPPGHALVRAKPLTDMVDTGTPPKSVLNSNAPHPPGHGLVRAKPLSEAVDPGHPEGHGLVRAKPLTGKIPKRS
ncbi:hypothetical protein BDZ94DRAFT_1306991 [Collybia nuda]|uniref:Uncharacterized protein n=1 Tax=Collybia nuda TaxID=64659 RepID=A0A9P6CGT7_9AGAR|nr:hypothetical protein BDZ94DRAFT_1306989 [Collybia nuda]KAF9465651.1 hypothetical protein BDZ94DRAFT_1306991 [Collybia nuda]